MLKQNDFNNSDDDSDFDENNTLKDFRSMRIPLTMADSNTLRDAGPARIADSNRSLYGLHRPGYRVEAGGGEGAKLLRDAEAAEGRKLYADYTADLSSQWRRGPTPPLRDAASEPVRFDHPEFGRALAAERRCEDDEWRKREGQRIRDEERQRKQNDRDAERKPQSDANDKKRQALADYEAEITQARRGPIHGITGELTTQEGSPCTDAMQHDVARHFGDARLSDDPGFRYGDAATADAKQAIRDAHDAYERDLIDSWRGPQRDAGERVVGDHIHNDVEELYNEYARTVENAWRKP
jgi:hypothetical protein